MRRIVIACAVLAGSHHARAQVVPPPDLGAHDPTVPAAPVAPSPSGEPSSPAPPAMTSPEPPPAAVPPAPRLNEAARRDRDLAAEQCEQHDPSCDWLATLSSLERASVERALVARGYVLDPSPWDKVIGAIRVYNEEVFAEGNGLLRFFNHFHVTTKESTIRAEAVIGVGEVWDQARVEETARRLRDPLWTSVVAVIP
ncbi:MAG: hypothetical protein ABIY55_28895, partial [Kofleriaceae bacterium]